MSTFKTNPVIKDAAGNTWIKLGVSEHVDPDPAWEKFIELNPASITIWLTAEIAIRVTSLKQVTMGTHSILIGKLDAVRNDEHTKAIRIIEQSSYADYSIIVSYDDAINGVVYRPYLLEEHVQFKEFQKAFRSLDGDLFAVLNNAFPTW